MNPSPYLAVYLFVVVVVLLVVIFALEGLRVRVGVLVMLKVSVPYPEIFRQDWHRISPDNPLFNGIV